MTFDPAIFDFSAPLEFASITKFDANLRIKNILAPVNATINPYDIMPSEVHPEGGREIEIILPRKPLTNTIRLTLESTNLTYFYQPPLTEEFNQAECDVWTETHIKTKTGLECWRPENVVGSYAVYHSSKRNNEYTTGKAFHIFRSQLTDALGIKAWAEFNRDVNVTGILIITLPQAFLDSATYPVVVDPTFGYTSIGGSYGEIDANTGLDLVCKFTASEVGTVTQLSWYGRQSDGSTGQAYAIIYSDSTGVPTTKLAVSAGYATVTTTAGWWNIAISCALTASVVYWLGVNYYPLGYPDYRYFRYYYDSGTTNQFAQASDPPPPENTFPSPSYQNRQMSVYATYTAGGGGTAVPVFMHHYSQMSKIHRG